MFSSASFVPIDASVDQTEAPKAPGHQTDQRHVRMASDQRQLEFPSNVN
jgi:hypothetical protein